MDHDVMLLSNLNYNAVWTKFTKICNIKIQPPHSLVDIHTGTKIMNMGYSWEKTKFMTKKKLQSTHGMGTPFSVPHTENISPGRNTIVRTIKD